MASPTTSVAIDEPSPVEDSEFLLRRFPGQPDQFDFTTFAPRLNAFLPKEPDTEGISLYREKFASAEQVRASATSLKVRERGGVVAVPACRVREQNMSIKPDTASDLPGHVVIPEINSVDYSRKDVDETSSGKKRIKELADRLARASMVRIAPTNG